MRQELLNLRDRMKERGIDLYIIPTTDFHGSEYVNAYFGCREYISGFTGSAGTLVVMQDQAWLWTDGRYFLQAGKQLEGSGITLMKAGELGVPGITEFIKQKLNAAAKSDVRGDDTARDADTARSSFTIGFDGRTMNCRMGQELRKLCCTEEQLREDAVPESAAIKNNNFSTHIVHDVDLAGDVWSSRPEIIPSRIYPIPEDVTGEDTGSKLRRIRAMMGDADYLLVSRLEDIAWIYNLRGSDIEHTPVFYAYALISHDGDILYIMDENFVFGEAGSRAVKPYNAIFEDISMLRNCVVMLDEDSVSYTVSESFNRSVKLIFDKSPAERLKAVKNSTEIMATKDAHLRDGAAMADFLFWLKTNIGKIEITEISLAEHLEKCRKLRGAYDVSFDTIAGYEAHGAIIHYSATQESDVRLRPEGFVLIDSGGQYDDGTTDITRTVALGPVSEDRKHSYTAVLKGHIALAAAEFVPGTSGAALDEIARKPIRELGLDFRHGTGHGVGHMLSVHEGPNTISPGPAGRSCCIAAGMITSDEPGVYLEGRYGIRIENEIICIEKDGRLGFEMITFCPYERDAIDISMLTEDEIRYIDKYHSMTYEKISPLLCRETADWLRLQCRPLAEK